MTPAARLDAAVAAYRANPSRAAVAELAAAQRAYHNKDKNR